MTNTAEVNVTRTGADALTIKAKGQIALDLAAAARHHGMTPAEYVTEAIQAVIEATKDIAPRHRLPYTKDERAAMARLRGTAPAQRTARREQTRGTAQA